MSTALTDVSRGHFEDAPQCRLLADLLQNSFWIIEYKFSGPPVRRSDVYVRGLHNRSTNSWARSVTNLRPYRFAIGARLLFWREISFAVLAGNWGAEIEDESRSEQFCSSCNFG